MAERLGIEACDMYELVNFGSAGGPAWRKGVPDPDPEALCEGCGETRDHANHLRWKRLPSGDTWICVFSTPRLQCSHERCYPLLVQQSAFGDVGGCPRYSSDPRAGYELLSEWRNDHRFCCVEIFSDYNYVWDVRWSYEGEGLNHVRLSWPSSPLRWLLVQRRAVGSHRGLVPGGYGEHRRCVATLRSADVATFSTTVRGPKGTLRLA